jgi:NAD+ diphosphatase
MKPNLTFKHCPQCGHPKTPVDKIPFVCEVCEYTYYFNPTIAAAGLILNTKGQMLFIERAKEPAKGKLAVVGGFIDNGEIAEDALEREIREEVGLTVSNIQYLACFPNQYNYKNITYPVLDFFYTATCQDTRIKPDQTEVASCQWLNPWEVSESDLAFPSMQKALAYWKTTNK